MDSGYPLGRIDQFFPSRKRNPAVSKEENPERESRKRAPGVSPSAKGTLDGFLVKSPDAGPRPSPNSFRKSPDVTQAGNGLTGGSSLRPEFIKRNLSLDIGFLQPCSSKEPLPPDQGSNTALLENQDVKEPPANEVTELKKFANDFLSLYCSEIPLAADADTEQELRGQKRIISPSLLAAHNKAYLKKLHIGDNNETIQEAFTVSSAQYNDSGKSELGTHTGQQENIGEIHEECKIAGVECADLRKPDDTPTSNVIKTGLYTTDVSSAVNLIHQTPKSSGRRSFISPGEEFWKEAIQVADGLYAPVDNLPVQDEEGHGKFQCSVKTGVSVNKFLSKNSSMAVTKGVGDPLGTANNSLKVPDLAWNSSKESNEKVTEEFKKSPMPVKHFDFKDKNLINSDIRQCQGLSTVHNKLANRSILNENQLDTSGERNGGDLVQVNSTMVEDKIHTSFPLISKSVASNRECVMQKKRPPDNGEEATTPSSSRRKDDLQLSSLLPSDVCNIYAKKGISTLYPWQVECLLVDGVLDKRNLVYCASTSAGKSFVAEILMLRRVISTGKMAILVLPYVSICAEKAEHLELLLEPLGKHVRSFFGNQGGGSLPKDTSVAVCTIEKANSLLNRLLEEGRLSELGIIVIDELHMVGDQYRGYLLELMLTKLRYAAGEGVADASGGESSGSSSGKGDQANGLQIVGMSATMPNVAAVADWLQAALYETDFRPVPLEEYIKVGNTIYNKKMEAVRVISKTADIGGKDPDHIVELCNEVVQDGHSVLLFCSSRKGCESTARHVARFLKKSEIGSYDGVCEYNDASSAIESLRRCPAGLDPLLEETLPSAVAYHHAGLTVEEREIVETCYRKGIVRVLTATSTLSAGVNLPARRVIFRQPRIGCEFIDGTRYRQMAGRAGRTGIDTRGESILVCKPEEMRRITSILNDSCPPLQSCLSEDKNGMTHAILEVVAGGIVQTASDIHRYVRCTLLNSTKPFQDVVKSAQDSLRWLCHQKFLEWSEETKLYSTTSLGRASFGSSLNPEESLLVLDDLLRAREGFVLASDLHLVYLVTPINVDVEPDWELYYERFMELSLLDQSVGNRVGVAEPFLMRMAHGAPMTAKFKVKGRKVALDAMRQTHSASVDKSQLSNEQALRIAKRFFVSLMLSKLVQETPVVDVCEAFKVSRGMIQSLQENAGRFAMMVSQFCERLGWHDLESLVSKFQNRVSFGVRAEIVELTTIPHVKGSRARALYKSGLRSPLAIAEATVPEIAKALFEFSSWAEQEDTALRRMQFGVAKKIKNGARKIVLDHAEEARLAAFTTFKSLGYKIPEFSPHLCVNINDSNVQAKVSCDEPQSRPECASNDHVINYAVQPLRDEILTRFGDTSPEIAIENLPVAAHLTRDGVGVNMNDGMQLANNDNSKGCPESTSESNFPSIACKTGKAPLGLRTSLLEVGSAFVAADDPLRKEQMLVRENGLNTYNDSISDKGPISVCNAPGGFDSFLDQWGKIGEFCFDLHFTNRSELNSKVPFELLGIAVCWEDSPVYYINFLKDLNDSKSTHLRRHVSASLYNVDNSKSVNDMWEIIIYRWNRIAMIMAHHGVKKFTWNMKVQIQALRIPCISIHRLGRLNIEQKGLNCIEVVDCSYLRLPSVSVRNSTDVGLMAWMLWPDDESKFSPNLEKLIRRRLSTETAAAANRDGRWKNQMHKAAHNGCCRRVAQIRALSSVLWKKVISENLVHVLIELENPLVFILADMELWGVCIDVEACLQARHILVRRLKELEKDAYVLAGTSFSLYATADIANVLFTRLKLQVPEGCNKGKKNPSTNKRCLDLMRDQHPIISVIKEHRTLAKLLNSTIGSICSRSRLCLESQKYKIHGRWLQKSTATGRLSMEEPNLQCVEHPVTFATQGSVRNMIDSSDTDNHQINARAFIIPTHDNWLLLTADYSQIELRLMAHFSKDAQLIELLSKPDGDIFIMLAAEWTGKAESTISYQERDDAKRLVYGILYGMGANLLSEKLECSAEEAAEKMKSFKNSFPGVSVWLHEVVAACHCRGYIETLKGRKRYLSNIKFGNSKEKAKAQRQAVNSICQGSAADIIKNAMISIHSVITGECERAGFAEDFSTLKEKCRIILQVHDELVLEVDSCFLRQAGKLLKTSMERAASLIVPLTVKLKFGKSWGSLEPLPLE